MKRRLAFILFGFLLHGPVLATPASDLREFAYSQRPGAQLPLDASFHDADNRLVRLPDILHGQPAVLVLGYFHCPNLCGIVRADLYNALGGTGLSAGQDYSMIALSIDPKETSADARDAKARDIAAFPLPGAASAWHFLTGSPDAIRRVTEAVGFRDAFDPRQKQFVHPAGIVFLTPRGIVSGYVLGVGYNQKDIRLGLMRAVSGRLQNAAFPVLLLCFHYDPDTGRYTLAILRLLKLAGALTALTIGGTLYLAFRRDRAQP